MKSTGMVRRIDYLGRVVIPKEIRRNLCIQEMDPLEIFVDGDTVVLRKYERGCMCCGDYTELKKLPNDHYICQSCIDKAE